jgi:hypothetical protein
MRTPGTSPAAAASDDPIEPLLSDAVQVTIEPRSPIGIQIQTADAESGKNSEPVEPMLTADVIRPATDARPVHKPVPLTRWVAMGALALGAVLIFGAFNRRR